jgi:hypothetical protein
MTGKPGRIEASGKLRAEVLARSPNMKSSEAVRNSRSENVSVSSCGLSDPVPAGNLPSLAPRIPFKIRVLPNTSM